MQPDDHAKAPYSSPEIVAVGDSAELTLGDGELHSDYLGTPTTKYGKYGQPLIDDTEAS